MKVNLVDDLDRKAFHNYRLGPRATPLRSALPFYVGGRSRRAHRVRSGSVHWRFSDGRLTASHVSLTLWCGQGGNLSKDGNALAAEPPADRAVCAALAAEPPADRAVCATCEGRARGAGQLDSTEIAGREVVFTPMPPGPRCSWPKRQHPFDGWSECGGRAWSTATRAGDQPISVCRPHEHSARIAGWTVEPIRQPVVSAAVAALRFDPPDDGFDEYLDVFLSEPPVGTPRLPTITIRREAFDA